jgi:MerR family transcriptional regulator, light-induced transcriptional regulator
MNKQKPHTLSISAVERETRLSKDVLRAWERRYGFPMPLRDANGERIYPLADVDRLRLLKRCIDRGLRPARLMGLHDAELRALAEPPAPDAGELHAACDALLAPIHEHDPASFERLMRQQIARQGLGAFVESTVAPMTREVGRRWEQGRLAVFEEHMYTEVVSRVLRHAIAAIQGGGQPPAIILGTMAGEEHGLGSLMAEALFALEGAHCISLGTSLPLMDLVRAAGAYRADVLALSVSLAYPQREAAAGLRQLRALLPATTELWLGGAGSAAFDAEEGARLLTLADCRAAVGDWRASR